MFGFYVGYQASFDLMNVAANALLIRSDINGPMWSLTVEAFATPLILASYFAHRRFGPSPLYAVCAILVGLSFWGAYVHLLGGWTNLAPLYCFVAGVLMHFAVLRASQPPRFATATGLLVVAVLIAAGTRKQTAPIFVVECLCSMWLVYLIAACRDSKVFAALDLPPVRLLGKISYSFYLFHAPVMIAVMPFVPPGTVPAFAASLVILFPLSWLSWLWIERPFVRLGRLRSVSFQMA
jgi:peptidoglycan/LPS O-acetylase OafA/YrhL